MIIFFFSSRRRHTRSLCDWSSDVCSSDLNQEQMASHEADQTRRQRHGQVDGPPEGWDERAGRQRRANRSEERRVGKECRSRWARDNQKKNKEKQRKRDNHI